MTIVTYVTSESINQDTKIRKYEKASSGDFVRWQINRA